MKIYSTLLILGSTLITTQGALIANYDFSDGDLVNDSVGSYDLTTVATGTSSITVNPDGSALFPGTEDTDITYLETTGPGAALDYTVSVWVNTSSWDQGLYQGIFSTNNSSTAASSWQLDVHETNIRVISNSGVSGVTYSTTSLDTNTWYNIVVRVSGSSTELWVSEEGDATASKRAEDTSKSAGDLQMFRLGTNRNSNRLYGMSLSNVQIYDDSTVDLNTLLAEGHNPIIAEPVPEPSSIALLGLGALSLALRKKRVKIS